MVNIEQNETYQKVKARYRADNGQSFKLSESQIEIFDCIFKRKHKRNHIMTYTRFGKTEVVSMAVLTRVTNFSEKWAIVAPTMDKAKIMMGDVIKHIFDNDYCRKKFEIKKEESLERIRRERSKERLTFRNSDGIGEIFILSAEATRKGEDAGNRLMGFGAPNVVEDESALIPDLMHKKAIRMLGDQTDNFLAKIGNPFKRNHFLKSFNNPRYNKISVDIYQGIKEGRTNKEWLDEMREEIQDPVLFGVMYECKFPDEDMVDISGYSPLFFEYELERAETDDFQFYGISRLGVDVAGGGSNYSVIVHRTNNGAEVIFKERTSDIMGLVGIVQDKMEELRVSPEQVFVDMVGIGKGVVDRLHEQRKMVNGVNYGEMAQERKRYYNRKAECFSRCSKWLKEGGKLKPHPSWKELLHIKYKVQSDRKIQIKTKNEMLVDGIPSPDVADALSLTFALPESYPAMESTKAPIQGIGTSSGGISKIKTIKGIGI